MTRRLGFIVFSVAGLCAAADSPLWESAKVVAIEQVSTPAREPDASCRSIPKGANPPAACRPSNLRAQEFWRVTVETGNKRFVVRPYRSSRLLESLNQGAPDYVNPNLTAASSVEVAVISANTIRLRTAQGPELPAMVDSQELLPTPTVRPATSLPSASSSAPSAAKVVLLEHGDFRDLEVQEVKSQDIGDGAALYSFTGDSSSTRIASNPPVFLVLSDHETPGGIVELSRLQVGKGTRQLVYSSAKNRSASSMPALVTQVSATTRRVSIKDPLPFGEYVVLLENSSRGFLFAVR